MRTATILNPHDPNELRVAGLPDDGAVTNTFLARRLVRTPCEYCLKAYEAVEELNRASIEVAWRYAEDTGTTPVYPTLIPLPLLAQAVCGFELETGGAIELCEHHGDQFGLAEAAAITREVAP